jgi:hypothetical protein
MSNIAIFVGRKHHAQKLMNIGQYLTMRGHAVYPITANNAINIDPPQMDIGQYVHVYRYLSQVDVDMVNDHVRHKELLTGVSAFWKEYSLRELMLVYVAFSRWLESDDKPDAVLVLHENNFWTKPLSFLCQQKGIPCFAFQEGLLRRKDQETMRKQSFACEYSTRLFVWGEGSKRQYIEAGVPEKKIVVAGASHLFTKKPRQENDPKTVTYFLPLLQHYKGDPQGDIEAIAAYCQSAGFDFIVRLHPFEQDVDIPFTVDRRENVVELILETDVALVQHSTTAIECLVLGTPIVEVNFSGKPMLEPLHEENPNVLVIDSYSKLPLIESATLGDADWIEDNIWSAGSRSLDIIAEEIEQWL